MTYLLFFDIEYSNKSLECLGRLDTCTLSGLNSQMGWNIVSCGFKQWNTVANLKQN